MDVQNIEISVGYSCIQPNFSVKIIFDVYTPRPHFIILQQKKYRKSSVTENEIQQTMQLTTEFLRQQPQYDNNAILSFHTGTWYQKKHKYFHAHLYVPKKPYCQAAQAMISSESSANYWSSSEEYLTRLNEDYKSAKIKYNQYRDKCLSMAHLCLNDPVSYYVPLNQFNTSKFTLVFLASSPRIGIITEKSNVDLKVLYNFMNNFYLSARKKLALINPLYENFGAHLCLYVGGKKNKVIERSDRVLINNIYPIKDMRLVGYVQMDEQLYLRWLPVIFQPVWLYEFHKSQHLVVT